MPLSDFMPELIEMAKKLHSTLTGVALVIVFAGLVATAARAAYGDVSQVVKAVLAAGVAAVVIAAFPDWIDQMQLMAHSVVTELNADPAKSHERFALLIAGPETATADAPGFWDVMFDDQGGIGKAVMYAVILLMGKVALAVMWIYFALQQVILIGSVAVSPLFIASILIGATKEVGVRFLLSTLAVILWPLGWALADIGTSSLLKLVASGQTYDPAGGNVVLEASESFFLIVLVSIWMLVSTIGAPIAISRALQTGSQVGASLLGSLGTALSQGGSYAIGAGATASMSGSSGVATVAAAGVAGVGGMVSGAAGSSGMILPAVIGTMAVMAGSKGGGDFNQMAADISKRERENAND